MLSAVKTEILACVTSVAFAFSTSASVAEPVLTVTGLESQVTYDIQSLESLGVETFATHTIWSDGEQTFSGVSLLAVVNDLGVESGTLRMSAINDYSVEIPVSDAVENGPIIATQRNGNPMSIREKGPLWVVYPYDSSAEYQSEVIYSRSIWQLDRILVVQ